MWYNIGIMSHKNSTICFQCNSKLILVSRVTEHVSGSVFSQTTSIYRCSNKVCQEKKDKEADKRMQIQKDKNVIDKKRSDARIANANKASV